MLLRRRIDNNHDVSHFTTPAAEHHDGSTKKMNRLDIWYY